jgi:putative oxidoreductase
MTETASRQRLIAIWALRAAKLTGSLHTVQTFAAIGWGQWFRYLTGLIDLAGALLALVPRWTCYGALLLTCTVGLATILSLTRPPDLWPALSLTLPATTLAWLTRPRELS